MTQSRSLTDAIRQYRLHIDGVEFWTPYWINWDVPPYRLDAPYRGKGSGVELERELRHALVTRDASPRTAEGMRQLMRELGLGVDCSGFVYHALSSWLSVYHISLSDHLVVSREDIQAALDKHPERTKRTPPELKEVEPLSRVCNWWEKRPADLTDVMRLVHPASVSRITNAGAIIKGDLIKLGGLHNPHIGVVADVSHQRIVYYSSDDRPNELAGVTPHTIVILEPGQDLTAQEWSGRASYHPDQPGRDGAWRLNIVASIV